MNPTASKKKATAYTFATVLLCAAVVFQSACGKKESESTSAQQDNGRKNTRSALATALENWREAGGVVDVSELTTPSPDKSTQNAATLHAYVMDDIFYKIPDEDMKTFRNPWESDRNEIHSLAKYYSTSIDQIKAAAKLTNCDWGIDYSEGLNTELPYLGYLRMAQFMVRADAISRFDAGDMDGTVESLKYGFRLSSQAANGKLPICTLVGIVAEVYMYDTINELCRDNPNRSLIRIRSTIESQNIRPAVAASLRNEATVFLGEMRKRRLGSMSAPLDDSIDPTFAAEIVTYLDSTRTFSDSITSDEFSIENAVSPGFPESWAASLGLSDDGMPVRAARSMALTETYRAMALLAMDLREQKLKTGKYPDPSTFKKTIDPYDGGVIKYELNPETGGFTLTSSATKGTPPESIIWKWR